jgi:hypothetical protein
MRLPFSRSQFFDLFGRYNQAWWPVEILLWVVAVALIASIVRGRGRPAWTGSALGLLWAWSAVVYHGIYFTAINPAAWLFAALFLGQAALYWWLGLVGARLETTWESTPRHWLAAVFFAGGLLYPVFSMISGHPWPRLPLFAVPCPTVLLTVGVLLAVTPPVPLTALVGPVIWSFVGGSAAIALGVAPDFTLLAGGVVLIVLALRRRRQSPRRDRRRQVDAGTLHPS